MDATNKEILAPEIFSVVVLYEDRETRDRVLNVSAHMEAQVGDEIALKFSWWRFDFLQDARLAEQATDAARVADMLVVSAHPGRALPEAFTQWIESWLPQRGYRESVLVALIGAEEDSMRDAASEYLREVATRARMDYLAKPLLAPSAAPDPLPGPPPKRSETKAPFLQERQVRPPSHWGINE